MRPLIVLALASGLLPNPGRAADAPMPKVAAGWAIERIAQAPTIAYPTAVVVARDGTTYLGQDPMDMPGPPTSPIDSVVAIKDGRVTTFARDLWSVMGLEWSEATLYVVHAPFLSAFRDTDGDGQADHRVDLITGLGPKVPGFNGINDHVASGIRLGMDGFLYVAVGDKGLPRARGLDGSTITMSTGGVIRIRPDGSGLEVVSTGERNPLSVALTSGDDVFTFGNDDDSKQWPNSLTHHVVGGHYGYPYEFLTAPDRALPIVDGLVGGAGAQGIAYNEDGLPARYRGNLFFCDWGLQAVHRLQVAPSGGTFRLVGREPLVEKGDLDDFRPFSIAVGADGSTLTLVDWAFNGWLVDGPKTGRIFRLSYVGPDAVKPTPRPSGPEPKARLGALDHPALSVRIESQRLLASKGGSAVKPLSDRLKSGPSLGRVHALWALDAIGSAEARRAIRSTLNDPDPSVRLQSARSSGIRRDRAALPALSALLRDPEPAVRREAAIAIGRLGDASAGPALYASLGDPDVFAAWSIRRAIRALGAWDAPMLSTALGDPGRLDNALKLADGAWAVPAVLALNSALGANPRPDPAVRARLVSTLAGLYRRYPEWSGLWYGTNPLAGPIPRRTEDWDPSGQGAVLLGLAAGLKDADPAVRRPAIAGLFEVGPKALPLLRPAFSTEADPANLILFARALGALGDLPSASILARNLQDTARPLPVRLAMVDALSGLGGPVSLRTRFALAYDGQAPPELIARVLPGLGRARALPPNDLAGFLAHPSDLVRASALASFPTGKELPAEVHEALAERLDDPSAEVRRAAIEAVASHKVREAIPRLVALAAREPHRREATRALAEMPDPKAVEAFLAALKDRDPSVRRAGESALVLIRDKVAGELEAEARKGSFVGPSAVAVERILTRFRPVTDWRVIGPFPRTTPTLFLEASAIDFDRPEVGAGGRKVAWQPRRADPSTGRLVIDDLKGGDGGGFGFDPAGSPDLAAYARAEVASDLDRAALMMVGSSGPILVLVNDRPVLNLAGAGGRPYSADSDVVRVALRKGVNRVVVRTRQGIGPWSFGVQLSETPPSVGGVASANVEGLRAFALSHPGDPRSGEAIFFDARGVGCAKCHEAAGLGTKGVGPALDGLAAKYDKAEVIRSVLEPSSRIANGYRPVVIARRDGTVLTGVIRSETADRIELVDSQGQVIRVAKSEVERRQPGEVSTMPTGLADGLSPVEFADLIAYLMTLKGGR